MLRHTQVERLQSQVEQEGVLRALNATQVAHQLGCRLGHVGHFAESLGIGQTMVALIRLTEAGEFIGVFGPIEVAAIHYCTAYAGGVAIHVLGGGVGYDISSPFKGAAVDGCGEGVIYNQGHTLTVSDTG